MIGYFAKPQEKIAESPRYAAIYRGLYSRRAEASDAVYLPAESLMAGAKGTAKSAFDLLVNAIILPEETFSMAKDDLHVDVEPRRGGLGEASSSVACRPSLVGS